MNKLSSVPALSEMTDTLVPILLVLGAVFAVLAIIWLVLSIYKMLSSNTNSASDEQLPIPSVNVTDAPDGATIAAITAAITAVLQAEAQAKGTVYNGFKLVSFKRSNKGGSWTQK